MQVYYTYKPPIFSRTIIRYSVTGNTGEAYCPQRIFSPLLQSDFLLCLLTTGSHLPRLAKAFPKGYSLHQRIYTLTGHSLPQTCHKFNDKLLTPEAWIHSVIQSDSAPQHPPSGAVAENLPEAIFPCSYGNYGDAQP